MKWGLTDEQIANRRNWLGASDAHTVISGAPEDRYALYLQKIGEGPGKKLRLSDWDLALRHVTEGLQMDWREHLTGKPVTHRGEQFVSPHHPFMGCTLDGWDTATGFPINAKHLNGNLRNARDWAIEHYTTGAAHEAIVLDQPAALLSIMHGEKEPEIIKIEVDPWFAEDLIEAERAFWKCVQDRTPPPDCAPLALPKQAVEVAKLRTIDLMKEAPNWKDEMVGQIERFANTDAAAKINGMARDRIKKLLPDDVGELRFGLFRARRTKANAITMALQKQEGEDDGSPE